MSQPTTRPRQHNPLPRLNRTPLTSRIRRDATTHNRPRLLILDTLRNPRRIPSITHRILLKRPRRREPSIQLLRTMQLICPISAELTLPARRPDPFDSRAIADFPFMMHVVADCDNGASALMTRDAFCGVFHGDAEDGPLVVDEGFV